MIHWSLFRSISIKFAENVCFIDELHSYRVIALKNWCGFLHRNYKMDDQSAKYQYIAAFVGNFCLKLKLWNEIFKSKSKF